MTDYTTDRMSPLTALTPDEIATIRVRARQDWTAIERAVQAAFDRAESQLDLIHDVLRRTRP